MAYEHQREANQVARNILDVVDLLTDEVPDQAQIAQLLAEGTQIVTGLTGGLTTESKRAYKMKFLVAVGLAFSTFALDKFLPDTQS